MSFSRQHRSAVVLCMDVGLGMSNCVPGEESAFEQAKKVVMSFVQRQVFAESKDEVALVLFGTDETDNKLGHGDQYQNITVHRHLILPDFDLLEEIQSQIQPGSEQADFLDALIVCMDLIKSETVGKKYERLHIAVFTDLSSHFSMDQVDIIIANLKKAGITLQFFLPFSVEDEEEDDEDGVGDAGGGDRHNRHGSSLYSKGLSEQQKEGIQLVRKMMMSVDEEGGLEDVFTFRESLERLSIFKKIERRPMAWPCQLTIGNQISIKIVGYKSVTEERVKKTWTVVDAKTLQKEDVKKLTSYCLNDDDETEIEVENTIQGFRYGSDIVPFSKVDQEQMKYKTDGKCFSVLGFTKAKNIQSHQYMGNQVLKIFAPKDDKPAAVALSALIQALDQTDMVAIVRYAYNKIAHPQVGVAFPMIKDKYECLVYVQLPYLEDIRQYMFSSLKSNKKFSPSEEQLSAVDSLIDSMSLVYDDGESTEELFKPSKIPNPQFQRLFQCLQHKAFNPEEPIPPIDQQLLDMLSRSQEVTAQCQAPLAKVKSSFPLQEAVKKKEQKTGQDIFKDMNEGEPDGKKAKMDEEENGFSLTTLVEGNITSVGSVNPDDNFRFLVKQKNANFSEVSKQLIDRIYEFLETKGVQYYRKSISCIEAFRKAAIELSKAEQFNTFLHSLKDKVEERTLADFWDILVQDAISLITKMESKGSTVTPEEAKKFLAPKEKIKEVPLYAADDGGDVDDLLDMM
ncbi:X-ray repair cross-complementing protein 5 [Ambystoma mexicanum]|uniref:X-ray repair cross-complementing protein 5 n=1 Tax=Ambystoma mexicanum TaxID=8296 RepID=UPI0037E88A3A